MALALHPDVPQPARDPSTCPALICDSVSAICHRRAGALVPRRPASEPLGHSRQGTSSSHTAIVGNRTVGTTVGLEHGKRGAGWGATRLAAYVCVQRRSEGSKSCKLAAVLGGAC